jgi:2-keto-4-pentenoate hydratase/2-oxohepta-3-ene-1,7-dioic acid hydratase in catechol pathway
LKLISFVRDGKPSYGCVMDAGVVDLGRILGREVPDLRSLIAENLLPLAAHHAAQAGPRAALADLQLLPVIPNPGKIVCVGLNYHEPAALRFADEPAGGVRHFVRIRRC